MEREAKRDGDKKFSEVTGPVANGFLNLAISGELSENRSALKKVVINAKGKRRIEVGHPWVFRSDVVLAEGATAGDVVQVCGEGHPLGCAFFNPKSQITLRWLGQKEEVLDRGFWRRRLEEALVRRLPWAKGREAYRIVFGESDHLPGLIVDRYGEVIVFQTLSLGLEFYKPLLIDLFKEMFHPAVIMERNESSVRELEGLPKQSGIVFGGLPKEMTIREGKYQFVVDPLEGQKTGLYLDQADNRPAVTSYAKGRVLDAFCYQGEFGIHAAAGSAEVLGVDSSVTSLARGKRNLELNQITTMQLKEANVFDFLRECQQRKEFFDTVILDPPPFVRGKKEATGGKRGYKEINLRAMKILHEGGLLVTCSCSQNFDESLFMTMLFEASRDTRREIQILEKRGQAADHPVLLTFPESAYLQCWILRVI